MLARSLLAVLCGAAAAVAAAPGYAQFLTCQQCDQGRFLESLANEHPHLPHPPKRPDISQKTIYQALKDDDRFSRVFKLVNFTEDISAALNDTSSSVTFLAPPNSALRPPRHGKHGHHHSDFDQASVEAFFSDDVIQNSDELELFSALEGFVDHALDVDDDDDDEEKKRKIKIIKAIVSAVLKYHILPAQVKAGDLAKNTTFPTSLVLHEGSLDGQPLRLRVEQPKLLHPTLKLNFYATVIYADVQANNGLVHVINHPLFPPPSVFTILFAFSDFFSTLTSALQHVNFTDAVDWHWNRADKTLEGSPALTFFAPTNAAFRRLPPKLKFFLFSPFGTRALKKLLALHVVPEYIFHSNWVHNATDELLPKGEQWGISEDPFAWMQGGGCHEEDFDFLATLDLEEDEFDRRAFPGPDIPAQPEADGYGYLAGEYTSAACTHAHSAQGGFPGWPKTPVPKEPVGHPKHKPIFHPIYTVNATLPTLLPNHTVNVHVAQFRSILPHGYVTKVFVNGQWVVSPDVPSRNGAVHVVKRLINPHYEHGHHGHHFDHVSEEALDSEWDDWEEWLPQWANEE